MSDENKDLIVDPSDSQSHEVEISDKNETNSENLSEDLIKTSEELGKIKVPQEEIEEISAENGTNDDSDIDQIREEISQQNFKDNDSPKQDDVEIEDLSDLANYLIKVLPKRYQRLKKRDLFIGKNCQLNIQNLKQSFYFSFDKDNLVVGSENKSPVCEIVSSEDTIKKVLDRSLNPQIGLLTNQIKVKGNLSLAMSFFNLFYKN